VRELEAEVVVQIGERPRAIRLAVFSEAIEHLLVHRVHAAPVVLTESDQETLEVRADVGFSPQLGRPAVAEANRRSFLELHVEDVRLVARVDDGRRRGGETTGDDERDGNGDRCWPHGSPRFSWFRGVNNGSAAGCYASGGIDVTAPP
jgi:hypothetical protein